MRRTGAERLVLSLAAPRLESSVPAASGAHLDLAQRLVTDLVYSGLFAFAQPMPDGVGAPRHAPEVWQAAEGREPIAEIQLVLSGIREDEMVWTVRVRGTCVSRTQLLGKRYVIDLAAPERHVHHFADQIVRELTGDDGIAQTRILFSRETDTGREIFVIDYDGRNLRQITRNGSLKPHPALVPGREPDLLHTPTGRGASGCWSSMAAPARAGRWPSSPGSISARTGGRRTVSSW